VRQVRVKCDSTGGTSVYGTGSVDVCLPCAAAREPRRGSRPPSYAPPGGARPRSCSTQTRARGGLRAAAMFPPLGSPAFAGASRFRGRGQVGGGASVFRALWSISRIQGDVAPSGFVASLGRDGHRPGPVGEPGNHLGRRRNGAPRSPNPLGGRRPARTTRGDGRWRAGKPPVWAREKGGRGRGWAQRPRANAGALRGRAV